ncbi:MAG: right-handed parallel beta-helix repeat-containing protein [Bacteroidales bacterium]|nr:right-handed parallel beta-helix repeat-containing protein [Bacteroidales bacterium]
MRYNTLTLVSTATNAENNTSELSNMIYVGTCYITNEKDNKDNKYPYPNSFRQAVTCANEVEEFAYMKVAIISGGDLKVPMQITMKEVINSYGLDLYAKNHYAPYQSLKLINGNVIPSTKITKAWTISDQLDSLKISDLGMSYFDTAMAIAVPQNVKLLNMDFEGIEKTVFAFYANTSDYTIRNAEFKQSPEATYIKLDSSQIRYVIDSCEFKQSVNSILATGITDLSVTGCTFKESSNYMEVSNCNNALLDDNSFSTKLKSTGVLWSNSNGVISNNSFDSDTSSALVLKINNSSATTVNDNIFSGNAKTNVHVLQSGTVAINKNVFSGNYNSAIHFENSSNSSVVENAIASTDSLGVNLVNSSSILMSRNTIVGFKDKENVADTLMAININRNVVNKQSNGNKNDPSITGWTVKRVPGDCKLDDFRFSLYIFGYAQPNDIIEVFFTDTLKNTLTEYIDTCKANESGYWEKRIPKDKYHKNPKQWYHFTVTATDAQNNTSQTAVSYHFGDVYNDIKVTKEDNSGANTLRQAVYDINCSDVRSRVFFNLESSLKPYEIVITDTLPHISAFRGFEMNGATQYDFAIKDLVETTLTRADEAIVINAQAIARDSALVFIDKTSYKSDLKNISFSNTANVLRIENDENTIDSLIIESATRGDTAINVNSAKGNVIANSIIKGYKTGVYVQKSESTLIKNDSLTDVGVGVRLKHDTELTQITESSFIYDSVGVFIDSVQKINTISKNEFGTASIPVHGPCVLVQASKSQYINENLMPYGQKVSTDSTSAFILVKGNSDGIAILKNFIGIDKDRNYSNQSTLRGIWLKADSSESLLANNLIMENEIVGLSSPAIYIENNSSGSVNTNYLGVDKMFNTKGDEENYSLVPGIEGNAIEVVNSKYMSINSNTIVNYSDYGVSVNSSEAIIIEKNRIFSEKTENKGINLHLGTAEESNNGVEAPVIVDAEILSVERLLLSGTSTLNNGFVQLFEAFDNGDQSYYYMDNVATDDEGNWSIELPTKNFGFSKYSKFVAQISKDGNSSEYSSIYETEPLLCLLDSFDIDLIESKYTPCPESNFTIDAQLEGLNYVWKPDNNQFSEITTQVATIPTTAYMVLTISDNFGCKHVERFSVEYKPKPQDPIFIVATRAYVGDTIVLVDVAQNQPDKFEWSASPNVYIVGQGVTTQTTTFPPGRYVKFLVPDEGWVEMTQTSLLDGCFSSVTRNIEVTAKDPSVPEPYTITPGFNSLTVYPSPVKKGSTTDAYIKTTTTDMLYLALVDVDGEVIFKDYLAGEKNYVYTLPTDKITAVGIYYVTITIGESVYSYKIVVN